MNELQQNIGSVVKELVISVLGSATLVNMPSIGRCAIYSDKLDEMAILIHYGDSQLTFYNYLSESRKCNDHSYDLIDPQCLDKFRDDLAKFVDKF